MKKKSTAERISTLRLPALEIRQGRGRHLYSVGIDGKLLSKIAGVSRVRRPDGGEIAGYQRPEVYAHIQEIQDYLESDAPMLPNPIIVA
ncbi:MAG TPA: hypothetical protein VEX86_06710, partial [Longimicrobium sp.]|nr:hypothetical protein [Longimicrobium sp.]